MAASKKKPEWEEFCVGEPSSNPNWINTNCCPLDTVYHIAHVSDAYRIFEDRRLIATLVRDESKLKETRSAVTWLSPNTWASGSLYGNIRFEFDWKELIQGKKFYWVEVMHYATKAFRIFVTDGKPALDLNLYRPERDNGPLYHDAATDIWYWNGDMRGDFMFDADLPLADCKTVGFENHHDTKCKKDDRSCNDLGWERYQAGARLLSRLIAQNVIHGKGSLRRLFLNRGKLHRDAEAAWGNILRAFNGAETTGRLTHKDAAASPVVTAMLDRYGTKRKIKPLGCLFRSSEELEQTLRIRVARAFDIPLENVTDSDD